MAMYNPLMIQPTKISIGGDTFHRIFYVEDDKLKMKEFLDPDTAWQESSTFMNNLRGCPAVEFWKPIGSDRDWERGVEWNAEAVNKYLEAK